MRRLTSQASVLFLLAAGAVSGCVSSPAPQPAGVQAQNGPVSADFSKAPGQQVSPDAIFTADPSAMRLQDIGGYLMLYYRQYQQMPQSLQELANLPGGQELKFTSASGQPFAYQQTGMWSPERSDKCIVAYDQDQRNGKRWVLFMTPPKSGAPLDVDVYDLPEPFFLNYRP